MHDYSRKDEKIYKALREELSREMSRERGKDVYILEIEEIIEEVQNFISQKTSDIKRNIKKNSDEVIIKIIYEINEEFGRRKIKHIARYAHNEKNQRRHRK